MEVNTVSPLFTSLTDGGNGAVLWLLHIHGITDFFIFNQAFTDFLFLVFTVPSSLLFLLEEVSCSAIMPQMYLSLLFHLSLFSYNMGLYRLMFISIDRCRSILCLFFCGCQLPDRLLWVLMSVLFWAFFFVVIVVIPTMTVLFWAFFFVVIVFNPTVTSLCQSHQQEHCRVPLLSMYVLNLFLFAAPMVISSTILFIHFMPGSQQQQHKRLDIVIFLVALSSLPLSLWYFLQQFGYTVVSTQVVFLLACINSSIKPFIYFWVGSWRRDYSMESCRSHCSMKDYSMESCRSHCSMKSLRVALHRVFEEPKENPACSGAATTDTAV
ncbi:PREDICTED: mas-related G-protein coupled receptor member A8-like [Ficedula albicollis]|uniref:mas-related G-protein coupled receptor member A8-like n=1 Tax=Ficedula albicollis TaxID=59894 RepID=UPI0007AD7C6A|nr:PREDICTED: mas-related G-protein coupled receptor member A8-like [Ficedula albicollis]